MYRIRIVRHRCAHHQAEAWPPKGPKVRLEGVGGCGLLSHQGVSESSGFSPQIIQFHRDFHYKPSILGYTTIFGNIHQFSGATVDGWKKSGKLTSWGNGRFLSHYLRGFVYIQCGWPWDFWTINSMFNFRGVFVKEWILIMQNCGLLLLLSKPTSDIPLKSWLFKNGILISWFMK